MQGLGGSCLELLLQVWSPAGSQAVDRVVQLIQGFGRVQGAASPSSVCASPEVLAVGAQSAFQVWLPRPLMEVRAQPGTLGLCAQAARLLIRVHNHLGLCFGRPVC